MQHHVIFITSPLEAEHVGRIRKTAGPQAEVIYDADLMPPTRYVADHKGVPDFRRDEQCEARWRAHLARATILFDFPAGRPDQGGGLALAPHVTWVQTTSSGVGQMVKDFGLVDSGVVVTTARGIHAAPLAEFAMLALLLHAKRHAHLQAQQRARGWTRYCGEGLSGKTLLVVGAGKVGAATGRLARAFGMNVIAVVRRPSPDRRAELHADEVLGLDALAGLVGRADAIVLAAPHTPATEGIVSASVIGAMKPGVVFVNIARGQLVDEDALIVALQSGQIGFAALDVARVEPLPQASPLWDLPNVLISPHSASTVASENEAITEIFCRNIPLFLNGDRASMQNILDKVEMY
jgi:phosphoglycerate dehydrogenase-like enzyme